MDNECDRNPTDGNCGRYPVPFHIRLLGAVSTIGEASLKS